MAQKIAISLNVFSSEPLSKQLFASLMNSIETGRMRAGEKLPSIRDMSKQLQVSTITVREAIDKLIERGAVLSRQGSGNYVAPGFDTRDAVREAQELSFTQSTYESAGWNLSDRFSWTDEAHHLNNAFNDSSFHPWWDAKVEYDFRVYQSAVDSVEGLHWNWIVDHLTSTLPGDDIASHPQGDPRLREALSRWLNSTRNLSSSAEEIFLLCGAQQARDLVARMLVKEGTAIVVEEPGSITDVLSYTTKGARVIHVPLDDNGIKADLLWNVKEASVAHLITPANFPHGSSLSIQRADLVLDWAAAHNVVIVEDSYGAGFSYENEPTLSLMSMARSRGKRNSVIYIGSMSQLLHPALRFAFAVIPERFHNSFAVANWCAEAATPLLSQQLVLGYLEKGYFEEDIMRVTQAARLRRQALLDGLALWPQSLVRYEPARAGFHQAVWFNGQIDDLRVFERALAIGIGVVPISPYYQSTKAQSGMSLSFAQMNEEKIAAGLEKLRALIEGSEASTDVAQR